ncbi:hypothetical protein HG619_08425 [Pseudomonas syringae]|nr:hypothetical protein [Pseudomonas syringae]
MAQCRLPGPRPATRNRDACFAGGFAPQALERYEYQGQYGWQKQDRGEWLSRVQIEQRESQARRVQGQSGVRQMEAGRWFELTQHPLYERKAAEERQFC